MAREGARKVAVRSYMPNYVPEHRSMPLQYLCILATRHRCAVLCTGNMYKVIDYKQYLK